MSDETGSYLQFHPRLINCKEFMQVNWETEQLVFFIISTSGDGMVYVILGEPDTGCNVFSVLNVDMMRTCM